MTERIIEQMTEELTEQNESVTVESPPKIELDLEYMHFEAMKSALRGNLTSAGARKITDESLSLSGVIFQIDASARMGIDTLAIVGDLTQEVREKLMELGYDVQRLTQKIGENVWTIYW